MQSSAEAPRAGPDRRTHSRPYSRIDAIDVLRGVAILGILVMNIRNYALPVRDFNLPGAAGGLGFWNVAAWLSANLLFEDKMIALLSLLFGAGLMLMAEHAAAASGRTGGSFASGWLRRCFWLLLFGVVHAIAIWYGDILNTYAIAGALLLLVRRWPARRLTWLGVVVLLIPIVIMHASGSLAQVREALALPLPQNAPPPPPAREAIALGGSFIDAVRWHCEIFFRWHVEGGYLYSLWRSAGLMLFGMALYQSGFFSGGNEPLRRRMLAIGYGFGVPLALLAAATLLVRELRRAGVVLPFDSAALAWPLYLRRTLQYVSAALLGLGHAALIVDWCQTARGALSRGLQARLAAAGRMALSNYLAQSLICTALFYGWGFGLFGRLSMLELTGVVAAIVVAQLALSPWWLARCTMGPFEWAWRSLTLWRRLPLRREALVS